MNYRKFTKVLLGAVLVLTPVACGDDKDRIIWGKDPGGSTPEPPKNITARMETPKVKTDATTLLISHSTRIGNRDVVTYSLEYDKAKLHSRWVAFRFDGNTRARAVSRSDEPFADDPGLPSDYCIGSKGFGKYNRGHLCASADRLYNAEANSQTFYMSNMSPQLPSFNQGYWITLENLVQRKGRDAAFADTLYVVKGGSLNEGQIVEYVSRSNGKKVAVPKYYYMALLKIKNGTYSSIAFWMEHKEYGYDYKKQAPLSEIKTHILSVNELENLSGIDFFPNLPDALEESVENQLIPSNWGL